MSQRDIVLREGAGTATEITLRALELPPVVRTDIYLREGESTPANIVLRDPTVNPSSGGLPVNGTASITEADDTIAATAEVLIAGVASITEADDTLAAAGVLPIVGSLSVTEDNDGLAATGTTGGVAVSLFPGFVHALPRVATASIAQGLGRQLAA